MQEGGGFPEQIDRLGIRARLAKLIPGRFKHAEQPVVLAKPSPSEVSAPTVPLDESPPVVEEPINTPQVEAPVVEEIVDVSSRVMGIATILTEKLRKKGLAIPEVVTIGASGILGTNETVGGEFLDAVQARNPEGYLVGVGAGNALTMLHCFQDGVTPKGVILADIDPGAVAVGKLLINNLKKTESAEHLERQLLEMPEGVFYASIQNLIASEEDPVLKEKWQNMDRDAWKKYWGELSHENSSYRNEKMYRRDYIPLVNEFAGVF